MHRGSPNVVYCSSADLWHEYENLGFLFVASETRLLLFLIIYFILDLQMKENEIFVMTLSLSSSHFIYLSSLYSALPPQGPCKFHLTYTLTHHISYINTLTHKYLTEIYLLQV